MQMRARVAGQRSVCEHALGWLLRMRMAEMSAKALPLAAHQAFTTLLRKGC